MIKRASARKRRSVRQRKLQTAHQLARLPAGKARGLGRSKAAAVRKYVQQFPDHSPRRVAAALRKRFGKVTTADVHKYLGTNKKPSVSDTQLDQVLALIQSVRAIGEPRKVFTLALKILVATGKSA